MKRLLPYLQLVRLPNVFTAVADVTMGVLFVSPTLVPIGGFLFLVAASSSLYMAGMVLNDLFDVEIDRQERPDRPLPSDRVSIRQARTIGFTLLSFGVLCGIVAGLTFAEETVSPFRSGTISIVLAACIYGYDRGLKKTWLGPVAMGSCRLLNILLGMSLSADTLPSAWLGFSLAQWAVAGGIGVYIAGVTIFARDEADTSRRTTLAVGVFVMAAGILLLSLMERLGKPTNFKNELVWPCLLLLLMASVIRRSLLAIVAPTPAKVQATVKMAIFSLVVLDAAVCLAVRGPVPAIAVLTLLIPMVVLGKWIYST